MDLYSVDSDEAIKRGDEALNASSQLLFTVTLPPMVKNIQIILEERRHVVFL
jgi:hypothetical protein